jgi:signal transduction histidine kinase
MASIVGYTEILMSESVGILGKLQRKFLERIKHSIQRMETLLDDLLRITEHETGGVALSLQMVDVSSMIDKAVSDNSSQMREKNIALHVDLPPEIPELNADVDALQQIIAYLLQNAGAVTPEDGAIRLHVRVEEDDAGQEYLLLQVTDSGGGIDTQDLPYVFSPQYRADHPVIAGIADNGVGLAIVKTLTEAHGGRIWVDSVTHKNATYSVILPIRAEVDLPAEPA